MIFLVFLCISGRQFEYGRALEIMQDESYLLDADTDDIKRKFIQKKIGRVKINFKQHNYKTQSDLNSIENSNNNFKKYSNDGKMSNDQQTYNQNRYQEIDRLS